MPFAPAPSRWRRSVASLAVIAVMSCAGCASPTPEPTGSGAATASADQVVGGVLRQVSSLIAERLATAPAVAAAKQVSGQPVTDTGREEIVLAAAETEADRQNVDAAWVREVFADQIAASKDVQYTLLDEYRVGLSPAPTRAPDLAAEVRPILDRITPALVDALASLEPYRDAPECARTLAEIRAELQTQAEPAVGAALPRAMEDLCAG